jgi:hypothetical protein
MGCSMRQAARFAALAASLLLVLVVAALPGTTSASSASAHRSAPQHISPLPSPILINVSFRELLSYGEYRDLLGTEIDLAPSPSYFARSQVISIYGHPDVCAMGELGCHPPEDAARVALALAREYDEANGARDAIAAFHLIVDVAQAEPGADGRYLEQMPVERIEEWVEVARANGMLIFLDIQVGWTDLMEGVERLEPLLRESFVHLAIDPEFATKSRGVAPGRVIGTLTAGEVNAAQYFLAAIVREHRLPPKILVIHQFTQGMLKDPEDFEDVPEVDLTIDMDGYGPPWRTTPSTQRSSSSTTGTNRSCPSRTCSA